MHDVQQLNEMNSFSRPKHFFTPRGEHQPKTRKRVTFVVNNLKRLSSFYYPIFWPCDGCKIERVKWLTLASRACTRRLLSEYAKGKMRQLI